MIFPYLSFSTEEIKKSLKSFFCGIAGIRVWLKFVTISFHQYLNKLNEDVLNKLWFKKDL